MRSSLDDLERYSLHLGSFGLSIHDLLLALGAVSGFELFVCRATATGFDRNRPARLAAVTIVGGVLGAHFLFVSSNSFVPFLIRAGSGFSSFSGMAASALVAALVMLVERYSLAAIRLSYDSFAFAFPFAWIFCRSSCALAGDHMSSEVNWLHLENTRLNLGLVELLYSFALAAAFLIFNRKPRHPGFYIGVLLLLYCPVRFLLDSLRVDDPGHIGWTTMQFACIPGTLLGAWIIWTAKPVAEETVLDATRTCGGI